MTQIINTGVGAVACAVLEQRKELLEKIVRNTEQPVTSINMDEAENMTANQLYRESYKQILQKTIKEISEEIERL